ncbi:hypothetical protein ALI44B_01125 [Leifsonia sp. ALI-44-B]|nr:hypothetical protein ALI44B_01125 [Leifsonia sp. ALI-44-B]
MCITVLVLTGCFPVIGSPTTSTNRFERDKYGVLHIGPEPTARIYDNGVAVWDLTVPPSAAAFGIEVDPAHSQSVGAYSAESAEGHPVRLILPEGRSVQVMASAVIFDLTDNTEAITSRKSGEVTVPEGRLFTLQVNVLSGEGPKKGREAYRAVLEQLGLPMDSLHELDAKITNAANADPIEDPARASVGESAPAAGGLNFGVSTSFPQTTKEMPFALRLTGLWDPAPIPSIDTAED